MQKCDGRVKYRAFPPPQSGSSHVLKTRPYTISGGNAGKVSIRAGGTSKTKPIYMRPIRPGRLAIAGLFMAMLSITSLLKAQMKTICSSAPPPTGWATVSYGAPCDSLGTFSRTIQEVGNLPSGATLDICGSDPPPFGWAVTSYGDSCARRGNLLFYKRTIKNLNGMAQGTTATVCWPESPPLGWVVVSTGTACATVNGMSFLGRTIKKL